jgi:hypothetical protein
MQFARNVGLYIVSAVSEWCPMITSGGLLTFIGCTLPLCNGILAVQLTKHCSIPVLKYTGILCLSVAPCRPALV